MKSVVHSSHQNLCFQLSNYKRETNNRKRPRDFFFAGGGGGGEGLGRRGLRAFMTRKMSDVNSNS